jgi:hypothetical protein
MINNNEKTSLLVGSQLPEFVQSDPDYENFRLFLQAYYEWMEQEGNALQRAKNLPLYHDIDTTTNEFLNYFVNDFLPYFPNDTLLDQKEAVKIARQLYQTKGTPASYKFLFKVLYNSDFDIFYTKDAVLRASAGVWYVAKSLKLATGDKRFLNIQNYRLFGETSKSIATVENAILAGTKIEVFISNIERLFQSGEFVRVVDNNNQDVLFDGEPLRSKIVGQISQINVDPKNRGLLYQPGDPVIVYNGLNPEIQNPIGAVAEVGQTTTGSIQSIKVLTGGYGYTEFPNTIIQLTNAPGANAVVGTLNPVGQANVALVPSDSIGLKKDIILGNTNYYFSNTVTSNITTKLSDAFTFTSFATFPLSSILVVNGGGGIVKIPTATAISKYPTDSANSATISSMGILGPVQILNGGHGYQANDTIVFTGGSGQGAYANVISVNATGSITKVDYVQGPFKGYPYGGMGYKGTDLPSLSVSSANTQAANAQLFVPGILGEGATFSVVVDRAGSVTTIKLIDGGQDYITTPNVSLKVQDIVVSNVSIFNLPQKGDVVYQGANIDVSTYSATVNSISELTYDDDPTKSFWNLRVFNYNSTPNTNLTLNIDKNIHMPMANTQFDSNYDATGVRNYGDGSAKATAKFLNGLVVSQGQYLNTQGQPSSFDVLQSSKYNNYTYQVTVQESIAKYRNILLNLLHPTGMRLIGRYAMKSEGTVDYHIQDKLYRGYPLYHFTGEGSYVTMTSDYTNKSNNIATFYNLNGANLQNIISVGNTSIDITTTNGPSVYGKVISVANNQVKFESNTWLTYSNVAVATGNSGQNTINIVSLTGAYDIINNGYYSNTDFTFGPLMDIIFVGDSVLVGNNTSKIVKSIDYANGIITLTTNLSAAANSYLSVKRNFVANSTIVSDQIQIFNPIDSIYQ